MLQQFQTRKSITPVHEYSAEFRGSPSRFKFTSGTYIDFTSKHNNWDIDPVLLYDAPTMKKEASKIQSFSPETYWTLSITVSKQRPDENCGQEINLSWSRHRVFDKQVANLFQNMVKEFKEAEVVSVDIEKKTKSRPHALNTVELLKFCSSNLGIGPQDAMSTAERLYTQGYISYPRTETTSYAKSFDFEEVLKTQSRDLIPKSYWKEESSVLREELMNKMSDQNIPEYRQGDILKVISVKMTEGKTSPPDYLSESEVIDGKAWYRH
ncbi:15948_t:CDS:10 [Acaulospora colombiana]|uniref:15948_t:CDS:1 n=1 Tax=Acaulospora colombiana TaxID=27376 RepID=A0ACA9L419_9GLOM|nr:15948_t:CDS:10 [Acaulospora colombiana]